MSNVKTYQAIINAFIIFGQNNLSVKRVQSSFYDQINNFSIETEGQFPILYITPTSANFNQFTNQFTFRVYCLDLLQPDRSNEAGILNQTLKVLNDLAIWLKDENDNYNTGIDLLNDPQAYPVNDALMDKTCGWYMDITIEAASDGTVCSIPFEDLFVLPGNDCNYEVVNQYLTCQTLDECSVILNIYNRLDNIDADIIGLNLDLIDLHQDVIDVNDRIDDLQYIYYPLSSNPANYITLAYLTGYATESWTTSNFYPLSNPANYIDLSDISALAPISYNSGTGQISIPKANTSTDGYLSAADWNTFNNKIDSSALIPYLTSSTAALTYYPLSNPASYITSTELNNRISSISLNTSGTIHNTPINFSNNGSGAWSATMQLATQVANRVFAGPVTGSPAAPTFRALVAADIPSLQYIPWALAGNITTGTLTGNANVAGATRLVLDQGNNGGILTLIGDAGLNAPTTNYIRGAGTTINIVAGNAGSGIIGLNGTVQIGNTKSINTSNNRQGILFNENTGNGQARLAFGHTANAATSGVEAVTNWGGTAIPNAASTGINAIRMTTAINASANGQALTALYVQPSFGVGAFTSVSTAVMRIFTSGGNSLITALENGDLTLGYSSGKTGFFGATPVVKQTITGSRSSGAALADLLTKLATLGLIIDSTTA